VDEIFDEYAASKMKIDQIGQVRVFQKRGNSFKSINDHFFI